MRRFLLRRRPRQRRPRTSGVCRALPAADCARAAALTAPSQACRHTYSCRLGCSPLQAQIVHVLRQYPAGRLVVFAYILGVHLFIYILLHRWAQLDAATDCRSVWPVLRKHRGGSIGMHLKRAMRAHFPPSRPVCLVHLENPCAIFVPVTAPVHYSPQPSAGCSTRPSMPSWLRRRCTGTTAFEGRLPSQHSASGKRHALVAAKRSQAGCSPCAGMPGQPHTPRQPLCGCCNRCIWPPAPKTSERLVACVAHAAPCCRLYL